ncbi:MAG: tRNA pseudouridine(55) synthase TruB, partial [Dehalococcoidia bacterium]
VVSSAPPMRRPPELHGILAIDKPRGWTSHDVVAKVRRIVGQQQVGHGGTLDPMATGLLPLGLGQGTRVLEYLAGGSKVYRATVQFGVETDTYDADGTITRTAPWQQITEAELRGALVRLTGAIRQRPPMYSAIKVRGEPLHRLARRGETIDVPEREVTVYRIDVLDFNPPRLQLDVECSGGTYVRSLAFDLGRALDSAAHLIALRRLGVGMLTLRDAVSLDGLATASSDEVRDALLSLDRPLWQLSAIVLNAEHADDIVQGRSYAGPDANGQLCRAYSADGRFLALLRHDPDAGCWRPHKVFADLAGKVS